MMDDPFGLKTRIETIKNNLSFYVLYWGELQKGMPEQEIKQQIDKLLDELSYLLRLKKQWDAL
jgi:ABC-type uncharacterized transport system ATPase subunit